MKYTIKFIAFMLMFAMTVTSAYATSVSFNPASGVITVTGTANGNTIVKVLPHNVAENSVTSAAQFLHINQFYSSGRFTYDFLMPDGASFDKYAVYVVDTESSSDGFLYYDSATADSIVALLNLCTSVADVDKLISDSAAGLGVDKESSLYISNHAAAAGIIYPVMMPFVNSDDFYVKYHAALAMAEMKGADKAKIEAILFNHQLNLGFSYSDYSSLGSEHKAKICEVFSQMNFASELVRLKDAGKTASFSNVFARTVALGAVKKAKNWIEIKDAFVSEYNNILGEIMSSNSSYTSSMESSVFSYMMANGVFDSMKTLADSFNAAVENAKKQQPEDERKPSPGNSGGSTISMPSTNVIPTDEYDDDGTNSAPTVKTQIISPVLNTSQASYIDVFESDWEHTAVSVLGGNGIVSGYTDGSFRPNNNITRAEFTKLIAAAFDIKAEVVEFEDVAQSDWFYPYVSVAAGSQIIQGYDGKFNPNANITRQDAAVIVYRLAGLIGKTFYGSVNFSDLTNVSVYALTAVRGLGNAGIINGDQNMNFNPMSNLTRAEAAQLLYNFIGKLAQ